MSRETEFKPPVFLRNRHIQSMLASVKLRRIWLKQKIRPMLSASESHIIDCGEDIRLQGFYSGQAGGSSGLVILLHGWEGSADSIYLLSAAGYLYARGFEVFRLNFRDHGNTHHLNPGVFHSCRIDEVTVGVRRIQEMFPHEQNFLLGFSLGGNFALRVGLCAPEAGINLDRIAAVCPVLDPAATMEALEKGWRAYHDYFVKKWRRSLIKKYRCFPELKDLKSVREMNSLSRMTDYFVPRYTAFPDAKTYYKGYAIVGDILKNLKISSHIMASLDDPVIPAEDLKNLAIPPCLKVETTRWGGHCGFIENYRLHSWAEQRVAQIFAATSRPG